MQIAHEYGIEEDIKREEQKLEDDKKNVQKEQLLWKKKVLLQAH